MSKEETKKDKLEGLVINKDTDPKVLEEALIKMLESQGIKVQDSK